MVYAAGNGLGTYLAFNPFKKGQKMNKLLILILTIPMLMVSPAWAGSPHDTINNYGDTITNNNNHPDANAYAGSMAISGSSAKAEANQAQGQLQGQNQGQVAVGSVKTKTDVTVEKPDRGLVGITTGGTTAPVGDYRGPFDSNIYRKATPWTIKKTWTKADLDGIPWCAFGCGDVTIIKFRELPKSEQFELARFTDLQPVGMIIVEGNKGDTPAHIWGEVATATFDMGGTTLIVTDYVTGFKTKSTGGSIGLGGGVSATNNGADNYGGSVGGGTGIGSVTVGPVPTCAIAVTVYAK